MVGASAEVGVTVGVAVGKGVEVGGEIVGVDEADWKVGATVAVGGEVGTEVAVAVAGAGADAEVGVGEEVGMAAAEPWVGCGTGGSVTSLAHATARSISRAKLKHLLVSLNNSNLCITATSPECPAQPPTACSTT